MSLSLFFFFNDTATTEIYTLSLHDALPILRPDGVGFRHPDGCTCASSAAFGSSSGRMSASGIGAAAIGSAGAFACGAAAVASSSARRAIRVTTIVTATVAAKPTNVSTCFAVPPDVLPVARSLTLVMSDPRYTYITTPG